MKANCYSSTQQAKLERLKSLSAVLCFTSSPPPPPPSPPPYPPLPPLPPFFSPLVPLCRGGNDILRLFSCRAIMGISHARWFREVGPAVHFTEL